MTENRKRIIVSVMAGVFALLVFLALFFLWQQYSEEKALYESADGERFAALTEKGAALAEEIKLARQQEKEEKTLRLMEKRVKSRSENYRQQLMLLVNPWNEVPEGYVPDLDTVEDGYLIDRRASNALMRMIYDCRAAGNLPVICSAYRTHEYQDELYQNKIFRLVASGVAPWDAPAVAARSVAVPGTSEHQLGLAVDIIDETYVNLDRWQENTAVQQWLMAHCTDYGFILRYPNEKSDITGIIYEPWHYRFVGVSTAKAVAESGLCFEEYLNALEQEK